MRVLSILCFGCLSVPTPCQVEAGDELPVSRLPLLDEPPAVQFVALARERGPKPQKSWSDMRVTLWEVQPGRAKDRAVRRKVLGHSHWNASPLLDSGEWLRWQIPPAAGQRGYSVKLLRVDPRTFETSEVLATRQAMAFGRSSRGIFLDTSDGQHILDPASGAIRKLAPEIRLLCERQDDWLVASGGVLCRFDAATAKIVRRYEAIKVPRGRSRRQVDWDGGRFAVRAGGFVDEAGKEIQSIEFGKAEVVYQELRVWNLQKGTERPLRVRLQAVGGSGVGVIPSQMLTELRGGKFRYTERKETGVDEDLSTFDWETDTEWVTIEIATGTELLREPYLASPRENDANAKLEQVPEYLRDLFRRSPIGAWGFDQDLAYAFLTHVGHEPDMANKGVVRLQAVCLSPDRTHLLVLHGGHFYHGNLVTKAVSKWAAPAALTRADVELHAIRVR